jgi:hypothetical protein
MPALADNISESSVSIGGLKKVESGAGSSSRAGNKPRKLPVVNGSDELPIETLANALMCRPVCSRHEMLLHLSCLDDR